MLSLLLHLHGSVKEQNTTTGDTEQVFIHVLNFGSANCCTNYFSYFE